ncbi:MAG: hypothetical protein KF905_03600 [Flavobacteriales bacterium]|nr:hypothetical protein [Flavobacteriales bacterium]
MLRRSRNLLLLFAGLLVAGFTTLVVLAKVYEPEVKQRLVAAINERLHAPVSVGDMDLTLIARFPNASLRLQNVYAQEVRSDGLAPDTLLYAEELFLEFSLIDLIRGNYTVKYIHGTAVTAYPALDRNGQENYLIWKSDSTSTSNAIALERVSFNELVLRFRDDRDGLEILTRNRELTLRGAFSDAANNVGIEGNMHLVHWQKGTELLLADRKADIRAELAFGGADGVFRITRGELRSGKVPLEFTLEMAPDAKGRTLDLRANGLGLPLAETAALLPEQMAKYLQRYGMKGEVDLAVRYSGPLYGAGPSLALGAKVSKGRMKERVSGTVLSDIFGELSLELSQSGTPSKLLVKDFSARSAKGSISGNWSSNGITNATLKADLHGDIALADLLRFAQIDTLEQVSGHLKANARVEGKLRDLGDLKASDLRALRIDGNVELRDATLKLKGVRHRVEHLDAALAIKGNDAAIEHLRGELQGSTITLQGSLRNLMPYLLFDDQRLVIEAKAASPNLDLAALLLDPAPAKRNSSPAEEKPYTLSLPATIELDLQVRVEELAFEDFRANAINGTVRMKDRVLKASPMTFNTASGAVLGSLQLDARDPRVHQLAIEATFKDINITQLFREFKDFGQDFIGHRHLSGRSQAHIRLNAPMSPSLSIDMQRLTCTVDIAIEEGGIKGHEPIIAVADHLKGNKLVAPFVNIPELRKRLTDIRFARLENRIDIRDGAVHIPLMEVRSTAMDIELSGTHWFDDRIDHHLNFRLSDLFRMGKPTRDEFGPIADDGTGMRVFLRMYGTASDPQFANDGAMAAARRKQQFQQEKQELRDILRQDLGLFKGKEGGNTTSRPAETGTTIKVDWGDPEPAPTTSTVRKDSTKTEEPKQRKGLGKLLQDDKDTGKDGQPRERVKVEE